MPVIFLALTPSLIFSMTFSGPTRYGSSVTTSPVRRAESCSTVDLGARLERAASGGVGVLDAVEPDDGAAGGQVGTGDVCHQVVEGGVRVLEQVPGGRRDLDQVVRRHVGRHADRDAGGAVDEQVRVGGRQHLGLGQLVVVVGDEVDDVLVEAVGHRHGGGLQPRLGVAGGGGTVVERPEVAVPVDQRQRAW